MFFLQFDGTLSRLSGSRGDDLLRRFGSASGSLIVVATLVDPEVAHAGAEEREWVASARSAVVATVAAGATGIAAVGVTRRAATSGGVALVESLLSARIEAALLLLLLLRLVLLLHAAVAAHLRVTAVRARLGANTGRKSVGRWRAVGLAAEVSRWAAHSAAAVLTAFMVHSTVRLTAHGRAHVGRRAVVVAVVAGEVGHAAFSDDGGLTARSTATQAAGVLSKVVVLAAFVAALPVTGAERNRSTATTSRSTATNVTAHATVATMAVVVAVTVTTVVAHHTRVAVTLLLLAVVMLRHAVALVVRIGLRGAHSRERASEASSATLEVRETTAGASPVTGTRAVL
jgi:hypothetical protein